jgi:hypothetical protein
MTAIIGVPSIHVPWQSLILTRLRILTALGIAMTI